MSAQILAFPQARVRKPRALEDCPRTSALFLPGVPVPGVGHVRAFAGPYDALDVCALCGCRLEPGCPDTSATN